MVKLKIRTKECSKIQEDEQALCRGSMGSKRTRRGSVQLCLPHMSSFGIWLRRYSRGAIL